MNFSTNQVKQLYVAKKDSTLTVTKILTPDKSATVGCVINIDGENTDLIPKGEVMSITTACAQDSSQLMKRKGVLIKLNDAVNGGDPVPAEHYILHLNYRGHIGEEDTYQKCAEVYVDKRNMTPAEFLQKMAKSLLDQRGVEATPLYDLYTIDGQMLVDESIATFSAEKDYRIGDKVLYNGKAYVFKSAHTKGAWAAGDVTLMETAPFEAISAAGFYIVEPAPFWRLGIFPETLMNIEVGTAPITCQSIVYTGWLVNYKFTPVNLAAVKPIYNTHKIADLEYFCKGERGVSAGLSAPYDVQLPIDLKVDTKASTGYDVLNVHYAFKGHNQNSTLSEKDITIVIPNGGATLNAKLTQLKSDILAI